MNKNTDIKAAELYAEARRRIGEPGFCAADYAEKILCAIEEELLTDFGSELLDGFFKRIAELIKLSGEKLVFNPRSFSIEVNDTTPEAGALDAAIFIEALASFLNGIPVREKLEHYAEKGQIYTDYVQPGIKCEHIVKWLSAIDTGLASKHRSFREDSDAFKDCLMRDDKAAVLISEATKKSREILEYAMKLTSQQTLNMNKTRNDCFSQCDRLREEAAAYCKRVKAEAETEAAEIKAEAEAEVTVMKEKTKAETDAMMAKADATINARVEQIKSEAAKYMETVRAEADVIINNATAQFNKATSVLSAADEEYEKAIKNAESIIKSADAVVSNAMAEATKIIDNANARASEIILGAEDQIAQIENEPDPGCIFTATPEDYIYAIEHPDDIVKATNAGEPADEEPHAAFNSWEEPETKTLIATDKFREIVLPPMDEDEDSADTPHDLPDTAIRNTEAEEKNETDNPGNLIVI